jgi:hypothetical protein
VPVPERVSAIFPPRVAPLVMAKPIPAGLVEPLTVRVLVVPAAPLLVIEPPPSPEVSEAIS